MNYRVNQMKMKKKWDEGENIRITLISSLTTCKILKQKLKKIFKNLI